MESANWDISKEGLSSHHNTDTSLLPKSLPPPERYAPEIPPLESFSLNMDSWLFNVQGKERESMKEAKYLVILHGPGSGLALTSSL